MRPTGAAFEVADDEKAAQTLAVATMLAFLISVAPDRLVRQSDTLGTIHQSRCVQQRTNIFEPPNSARRQPLTGDQAAYFCYKLNEFCAF
jgi:hypothetical protein